MSKIESSFNRVITRRDFLSASAATLAGVSALKSLAVTERQKGSPNTAYSPVIEKIKQTLPAAMALKDITGASIALVDGEKIVWSEGFGYTNRAQKVKVTGDTLFHVGSISKSFTALGVLKAVDKNLLALDDVLKKHLPWFSVNGRFGAAEAEKITMRHLLSHHSGLGTWSPLGNPSDAQYHRRMFEQVVKSMTASWLKFPAGERFEYSNQGIDLAGYALEAVSGKPFADFMREELLAPLGMTASTFSQQDVTQKEACAVGYLGKRAVPVVNGIVMPLVAAGGLFASANDLARFIIFHLQGGVANGKQLLPQKLLQEMYAPQFTARHQMGGYGLGIYKAIQHDTVRLSHGGLGYGISAHYRFLPEHKIGVVLLTNQDAAHNAPEMASRVVELMLTAKLGATPNNKSITPTDKPVVSLDESTLRRFEGTYLLYEGILFRFKFERGNLFHVVGREKLKLEARSSTEFTSGSRMYKFLLAENGKPKGVQVLDSYYDPQAAENSVMYLPVNDTPTDTTGLNKPEWSRRVGKYTGTFIGGTSEAKVSLENGYLYLNGELKLAERTPDFFIAADGEAVIFKDEQLSVGNKLYVRKK
ncbi:MAG TPA: serine hydrolase domain-containing protein [Pyrinomonadaceae bacterium]|nr:serine hydrolase domain-containing protein [Pyrinomonadaceae bacterium]